MNKKNRAARVKHRKKRERAKAKVRDRRLSARKT